MSKRKGGKQARETGEVIPGLVLCMACPELPQDLAGSSSLIDRAMTKAAPMLANGVSWGDLSPRCAAEMVELLVQLMCYLGKRSLTVRLCLSRPQNDCDHVLLEIAEVR